jgi:hypothetical protein
MIRKFIQNGKLIEGSLRNRKFRDRLWVDGKLEIIKTHTPGLWDDDTSRLWLELVDIKNRTRKILDRL